MAPQTGLQGILGVDAIQRRENERRENIYFVEARIKEQG